MQATLEYIKKHDSILGDRQIFYHLMALIFCSTKFAELTYFYYYSFPLRFFNSNLAGVLGCKKLTALNLSNTLCVENAWYQILKNDWLVSIQYRVIETEGDWRELVASDRNQLEGEILVALVYNERYLQEIKRLTLSGVWKRIPFFIDTRILSKFAQLALDRRTLSIWRGYSFKDDSNFKRIGAAALAAQSPLSFEKFGSAFLKHISHSNGY